MDGQTVDQRQYIDNAIRAVQNKKQVPEIDFTLHTMEDGSQVSTQERVCKGEVLRLLSLSPRCLPRDKVERRSMFFTACVPFPSHASRG